MLEPHVCLMVKPHYPSFSVIISVYDGDHADWLHVALQSIIKQTVAPAEILITRDGRINPDLQDTIDQCIYANSGISFRLIETDDNMGRGHLLALAVEAASHELVAIMDADDISLPDRFEKQLQTFLDKPEIDVLGGSIEEFEDTVSDPLCVRKLPETHEDILRYARWRNPINQMTVMFRKASVIGAGNYEEIKYFEDMWLWYRMIREGYRFYNLPEVLVSVRGGVHILSRRTGLKYIKHEICLLKKLRSSNCIGNADYLLMLATRIPVRLLPKWAVRHFVVRLLRAKSV